MMNETEDPGRPHGDPEKAINPKQAGDPKKEGGPSGKDDDPTSSKPTLGRLARLAAPELGMLLLSFVLMIASEAANMVTPLVVANAYDVLVDPAIADDERMPAISRYMVIAIFITIGGIVAGFLRGVIQGVAGERVVARLRCRLYERILRQEIAFFDEHKTGELVSRLGSDTTLLQAVVSQSVPDFLTQLIKSVAAVALMFYISPRLAGLALGGVLAIFALSAPMGRLMGRLSKRYQDILGRAQTHSTEAIGSMRTVQAFAAEGKEAARYAGKVGDPDGIHLWLPPKGETTYRVGFFKAIVQSGFFSLLFGAGFGFLNVTLWYGFYLVTRDEMTLGGLTAFNAYIISIGFAMGQMAGSVARIFEGLGASGRVFYLLDRTPLIPRPPPSPEVKMDAVKPESMEGRVEFEKVSFSYPSRPEQPVLEEVSLSIPANTTTALVGSSGSGKSTMVSLLQRFYDINQGKLTVDGNSIASLDLQWLRENIGYVQQEPQLFGLTIRENMLYGVNREVSKDELESASKDAHAHEFIAAMPEGYDTLVGERGVKLSGGQKQRVAIARALLTDPRILLLDEATSALDAESEHLVQLAIDRAVVGRTVVVVAHRLSTIRHADQIVVMDNHKVVDVGKHDALLGRCAKYQDLIKRQNFITRDVSVAGLEKMLPDIVDEEGGKEVEEEKKE